MSDPRISWGKSNEDAKIAYRTALNNKLTQVSIHPDVLRCLDLHCKCHHEAIDEYTLEVLEAIELAGEECLPSVGGHKQGKKIPIPGWSEYVQPYKQESQFWFSVWLSLGRPEYGDVFDNMKHSKKQYKFAVRRLQRPQNKIQNDKFVSGVIKGGVNIFEEIRKYRGGRTAVSSRIDQEVGAENISNHFATIYSDLYNKVATGEKLTYLKESLENDMGAHNILQLNRVDEDMIREALKRMKSSKRDAVFNTVSDCYINGPPLLISHLTSLVKLYLSHGVVPYTILICTLIPLVKDNLGDITSSDNYRAIAGGCLLLKLLDIVILLLEGDKLGCDELQFGYQVKSSTTMCTWGVTAVVDYYTRHDRAVYGCAMDMTKAFDMVEWSDLFDTLRKRGVSAISL